MLIRAELESLAQTTWFLGLLSDIFLLGYRHGPVLASNDRRLRLKALLSRYRKYSVGIIAWNGRIFRIMKGSVVVGTSKFVRESSGIENHSGTTGYPVKK